MRRAGSLWALFAAVALFLSFPAPAREIAPGADLQAAVDSLHAGDQLVLRGGTYVLGKRLRIVALGTASAPIAVKAAQGERVVIKQTNANANIIEIAESRHFILRGLELQGGSHGVHLEDSDFITVEDCEINHTGDAAIAANAGGTYEDLRLLRNHIHHTDGSGEGMYLGCNEDACRVANSLIEGNHIHHTNGATVEEGDGIELKEGSYGNIIRDNVVHDTRYPGIITYGTVGNGAANIIEGNAIWNASDEDNAIQAAADAIIRNNIVLGSPIALQRNQNARPANIEVVHNTIISDGDCITIRDVVGAVLIANNAVYSHDGAAIQLLSGDAARVAIVGNVGMGGIEGAASGFSFGNGLEGDFVSAHFGGGPPIDLFPKPGSALIGAADPGHLTRDDFNHSAREGAADVGAYKV